MTSFGVKNYRWACRVIGTLGLVSVIGCGSGGTSGSDLGGSGQLSARVFWEQSDAAAQPSASLSGSAPGGGFGAELPAAVSTVRLDFAPSVGEACCVAIDPSVLSVDPDTGRRSVVLTDIPAGDGLLTIAGFPGATAAAPFGVTSTCALDPADAASPCTDSSLDGPSFLSEPAAVAVRAGAEVNAGDILVPAIPFIVPSSLAPPPGGSVSAPFQVGATVAIASRDLPIDQITISTDPGGPVPVSVTFCDDLSDTPCSPNGELEVRGLRTEGSRSSLGAGPAIVEVLATRLDGKAPLRVSYDVNVTAPRTPTPTSTVVLPTPTGNIPASPTRTNRPPATATLRPPATPTRTRTRLPTGAPGSPTATPDAMCGPIPATDCIQSIEGNRSTFILSSPNNPDNARLLFRWERGNFTDRRYFGDPGLVTSYALCVYDQVNGNHRLVSQLFLPPGPDCSQAATGCWRVTDDGFRYDDDAGRRAGIEQINLAAGLPGRATIRFRAGGSNFETPSLPFRQNQNVVVQLRNDHEAGYCWEARFSRPATRNDAEIFRDAGDSPSNP